MQWDTRNFGQKLGAGLGSGLQNFAKIMMLLNQQKQEQSNWQKMFDLKQQGANTDLISMLGGPQGMQSIGASDYAVESPSPNLTAKTPYAGYDAMERGADPAAVQQAQEAKPYMPLSGKGKEYWDLYQMLGDEKKAFETVWPEKEPAKEKAPKFKDVPNVVGAINEEARATGRSKADIFKSDHAHRVPALQQEFPGYFGPNAADSIVSTSQYGQYPPPSHISALQRPQNQGLDLLQLLTGRQRQPGASQIPPMPNTWGGTQEQWIDYLRKKGQL